METPIKTGLLWKMNRENLENGKAESLLFLGIAAITALICS